MSDDTTRGPGQDGAEQPASGSVPPPPAPPAYEPDAQRAYGEAPPAPAYEAPPAAPYGQGYGTPLQGTPPQGTPPQGAPAGYGTPPQGGPQYGTASYDAPQAPAAPSYAPPTGPAYGQVDYGQQSGYPAAPPYGAAQGYPASYTPYPVEPKTNVLAIISLIASIVGFIWIIPFLGGLAGAIMGHLSLGQIKKNGEKGRGLALAGIIVGWAGVGLFVIGAILFFSLIAWSAGNGARYGA